MQNIKASIFLYLTPRQKSQLLGTLKSYYKKHGDFLVDDLCAKFLDDEKYYIEIQNPHFEFMENYLNDDIFYSDLKKFFNYCTWEGQQKKLLQPYLDKQKEIQKELRKKANDYKMSKLKPTKKQLLYYDKITKAHNIQKKDVTNATRLDLRNWIMDIVDGKEFND